MMSLMQTQAKDDSSDMSASRAALLKSLEDVATNRRPSSKASIRAST